MDVSIQIDVPIRKKGVLLIMAITLVLCLVPRFSQADGKISLKLQGGLAYLQAGDVNPGTQAFLDWGTSPYAITQGEYKALHHGYEVGGDLIFELGRNFGVGVGAGFLRFSKRNRANGWEPDYGPEALFTSQSETTAILTRVSVQFSTPLSRKMDLTANAGVSYFINAKYSADWQETDSVAASVEYWLNIMTEAKMKRAPFGFQGGLGFEYRLTPKMALLLEAQGRWAKFRGLEGSSVAVAAEGGDPPASLFSEEGKLYFESVPLLPDAPRLILVQSDPPDGPEGQARLAVVDFSGVSLQAGIRFYF